MVKTNIQTFTGEVEILSNLHVGSYLTANGDASNVLDVTGNVGASFFVGDGGLISNIATTLSDIVDQGNLVSNVVQFNAPPAAYAGVGIVTASNVGIQNSNPLNTLSIADKVVIDKDVSEPSTTMNVHGKVYASRFEGDGGLLSNIATTLEAIINQGNVSANVVKFSSATDYAGAGLVTDSNVGIQNTAPVFNLSVGSNVHIDDEGSNVLTVHGNVSASNLNLGVFTVSASHGLDQVCAESNVVARPVRFSNVITAISAVSNIESAGTFISTDAERGIDVASNIDIGGRLKFDSNVFIDTLRVADVASNIVTYDRATGELTDSMGTFMNKFAVVSEQPPSDLFANATTVTNHGGYTLTTSNLATNSNTFNAFDGTANAWVSGNLAGGYIGGANVFHENNLTQLSNLHPTQFGDWLAIEFPYKTTLRHMKLTPLTAAQFPASANIYATNNDLTWTEVNYWSGRDPVTASNVQTITVNATEQFKKYALVATKAAGNSSNVAIQDWQLFTESFSIDGGKVAMAQQAATGGETVMDQHGPHGRDGAAKLKKYPEIAFEEGKFDANDSTNTYVQAGYTVTASSSASTAFSPWRAFNNRNDLPTGDYPWISENGPDGYTSATGLPTGANGDVFQDVNGAWLSVELPHNIKLSYMMLSNRNDNSSGIRPPKDIVVWGSLDGTTWTSLKTYTNTNVTQAGTYKVDINSTTVYKYFRLHFLTIHTGSDAVAIGEWELYGYEELATQGDTSIDTTFTSIMNTPQTTGTQVYVDGSLGGNANTNRVVGPAAANTAATYDTTGKYWELNGTLTSNISVEANTFLEGDQPHAVSVWFNSSNLEANVSNTCVFSVSDQEKLDSVNLDLQSNTWHNLTYAYQGEGGSRVTYLDGRKVAEDQAEDTFGDYPPFAMTGYSQGGYVVSASSELGSAYLAHEAFNGTFADNGDCWLSNSLYTSGTGIYFGSANLGTGVDDGEWLKLEMPHRLVLDYISICGSTATGVNPKDWKIYGSNDDKNWDVLLSKTNAITAAYNATGGKEHAVGASKAYKYFALVVTKSGGLSGSHYVQVGELEFYGHRENDLVRLPDPTNVLKYPHIAMTGPAQRGYVATGSTYSHFPASGDPDALWRSFDGITGDNTKVWKTYEMYTTAGVYSPGTYGRTASSITDTSSTQHSGEYLVLETPHKIKLSSWEVRAEYAPRRIVDYAILGSDTNSSSANKTGWTLLTSGTFAAQTDVTATVSSPTTAFKYHAIVVKSVTNNADSRRSQVHEMKLYGTGVNSIPIQIGGGNIDKVANFRVYDKFVGEDQALEIWDAQKDEFGRAKSSMTLQKGRLGIGTTEPEGRLAVADEPDPTTYGLQEFPPKPLSDSLITHIEGHGIFKVYASVSRTGTNGAVNLFDKKPVADGGSFWLVGNGAGYNTSSGAYEGESGTIYRLGSETSTGQYVTLEMPYPIKLEKYSVGPRSGSNYQTPKDWELWGSNDGLSWTKLHNVIGNAEYVVSVTYDAPQTNYYRHFGFVVTRTIMTGAPSGYDYVSVGELKLFGTREQVTKQSVLHDGQLTLTKSLNVPRIGPALDADDTPRRDRLVVEYNTSTNPTFEGAVRDTSGRGNDGVMIGSSYSTTDKSLSLTNSPTGTASVATSYITRQSLGNKESGNFHHSVSLWFKMTTGVSSAYRTIFEIGPHPRVDGKDIALYVTSASTTPFGFASGGNTLLSSGSALAGQVYHIVIVYDGVKKYLYIDGVLNNSAAYTSFDGVQNMTMQIGRNNHANANEGIDGSISNFKMYVGHALEPSEVKTLYDMGRCDEGHHMVNFSKTRVGIGLGDGEAPRGALDVRGDIHGACPVYFCVRCSSNAGAGIIPWDDVLISRGGGFNSGNGIFTVPLSGVYSFSYALRERNSDANLSTHLQINGVDDYTARTYHRSNYAHSSITFIRRMAKGDTISIVLVGGDMVGGTYNQFTGQYISSV
jgi:hypothetical protein